MGFGTLGTFFAARCWQKSRQVHQTQERNVSFRKRPKRIKGGVVKVVNKEIQRISLWLSAAQAG
jgi:hypothetical protein